jgi:hypothetical protein
VCAHFVSDDFFYTSSYDQCVAPCGHCPAHYSCFDGEKFCSQDDTWADPVVTATATPMQVAPGDTVQFEASATSPVGDTDFVFHWHFSDDPSNAVPGPKVTHTYTMSGAYQETVDVDAANDTKHAEGNVTVMVCGTAGTGCSNDSSSATTWPPCCAGLTCVEESSFEAHCQ